MKFLHTSDWHLGMTYQSGCSYIEDQKDFIQKISNIAVENKVDGILLAGDVFDKSIASQEALKLYDEAMTHICGTLEIPVFSIAGNHDGAERLASCHDLLEKSGLHVLGAIEAEPKVINLGDVDIYLLPWISTDKVKTIFPDEAEEITGMEDAYRLVLDKYRAAFVPGHKNILVSHAFIINADTSTSDRAAEVGHATMVGSFVFDGFDYVALGHLHGPQRISDTICYSGTPMAYSFGKEEKQEKSVVIIDTDTWEQTRIPIIPLRKRMTIKGTLEELLKADRPKDEADAYVKLEVTDAFLGMDTIAALRERYSHLMEVSGKSLEKDDARITMTIDEFEAAETNPKAVFSRYCEDILEEVPDDHIMELFDMAVEKYEKEVSEQ